MFKKVWKNKKFRFLCAGIFNTAVDFTILNTLVVTAKAPVWLANVVSVCIAASISYFLNHHIVFRHPDKPTIKGYLKFFIVTVVGVAAIQTVVIYATRPLYADILNHYNLINGTSHRKEATLNLGKAGAILIGMVWNYTMYSLFVFKKNDSKITKDPII